MYIHIYVEIHVTYVYIHIYVYNMYMRMYTYTYTYTICTCASLGARVQTYVSKHMYMYTLKYIIWIQFGSLSTYHLTSIWTKSHSTSEHMYIWIYIYVYVNKYTYIIHIWQFTYITHTSNLAEVSGHVSIYSLRTACRSISNSLKVANFFVSTCVRFT